MPFWRKCGKNTGTLPITVFAFVAGERREWVRAADDGEPSGTAGRPMLDVLLGEDLYNTAVVVTRYFGGTLLGTGGLVRAYSRAVQEALKSCVILEKRHGVRLEIRGDYTDLGKIQYILGQRKIPLLGSEYTDRVLLEVILPKAEERDLLKALTEATGGKAVLEEKGEPYYGIIDGRSKAVLNLSRSPALHKSHPGCQRSWTELSGEFSGSHGNRWGVLAIRSTTSIPSVIFPKAA